MMYLLLLAADALFALQFLFTQKYEKLQGNGLSAVIISMIYSNLITLVIMLAISGFRVEFSLFSLFVSLAYSILCFLCTYASLKAFATANLSVYSIFMMLGGMLLPFAFGILFLNEALTVGKIICVMFIILSLLLTGEKGESKKGAYKYYFAVFLFNGSVGVVSALHQSRLDLAVNSNSFMVLVACWSFAIPLVWYLVKFRKFPIIPVPIIANLGGSAACNGLGNLFLMIALTVLPASVQYPIVTGGTMIFSAIIGLCMKEKLSRKKAISLLAAVIATIMVIL